MSLASIRWRFEHGFGALIAVNDSSGEIVGVNFYSDAPSDTRMEHPIAGVAATLHEFQETESLDASG